MIRKILLTVVAVSLLELAILVRLGMLIGFWPMLAVVFGVGIIGLALARSQGLRTLRAIQNDLAAGRVPAPRLIDQALIMVGGLLLILPGLLSDVAAIALFLPPTRALVKRAVGRRIGRRIRYQHQATTMEGTDISDQVEYTVIIP